MGTQLERVTAAAVEVIDLAGLAARAAEVAARQRSPETRRTYAAVYRSFGAFLGPNASPADVTPEAVRAYRDALEHAGRSPATVAKHLPALRGLADALGAGDPALRAVRSARVARGEPRALDHDEWQRLLRMPDRCARQGKRDLALLHLLGSAGLRRAEASALLVGDVDERRRSSDPRLRQAIKGSTSWWVTVRYGKRGRTRAIPLDEDTLAAITAWVKVRPAAATEHPVAVAAAHRAAAAAARHARHRPHRRALRHGRRAARGPALPARAAPHLLHPPRRQRRRHRRDPRARRPRRHPHHNHLHRCQRRPPRARHRSSQPRTPRRPTRRRRALTPRLRIH
jgi:site-specific recombinase XerD